MVMPLARGLRVLTAFRPGCTWMGTTELADDTGLPRPTVTRLLQSLVALGFVRHDPARRKYGLAAAALSLGYAAVADAAIHDIAGAEMAKLAGATDTCVLLGTRNRLDMIVLETRVSTQAVLDIKFPPGARMSMATSLMGWALLAGLPPAERIYLEQHMEREAGPKWPVVRRQMTEKVAQVQELGFCMLHGEWKPALACVAAPMKVCGRPPMVLACVGRTARMARARVELTLGPQLVTAAKMLADRLARAA